MWSFVRSHILLVVILTGATQGLLVVGPRRIRSHQNYTLAITNPGLAKMDLMVRMEGCTDDGASILNLTEWVDVRQHMNQLVNFELPNLRSGNYKITMEGQQGVRFHKEAELVFFSKSVSGLIQLDKPVFKPGDSVHFRVIVLDSDLKPPAHVTSVNVAIQDPHGNVIRRWSAGRLHVGVFEGRLEIASMPLLGIWHISVKLDDEDLVSKTFEVKEYELSTFDVDVFPTTIPLEEHQGLNLTISAFDYVGTPVRGTAMLSLYLEDDTLDQTKTWEVDGIGRAQLNFKDVFVMYENQQDVLVDVTFIEKFTNRTVTKQQPITVYKHMYDAELIKESPLFRPGVPYKCEIQLKSHNETPAKNVVVQLTVEGLDEEFAKSLTSDQNGVIELILSPSESADAINVAVTIGKNELLNESIDKFDIATDTYVIIERKSNVELNKFIVFSVACTEKITFIVYYVVSKGNIVDGGYMRLNKVTRTQLQINATSNMIPKSKIIVATFVNQLIVHDVMDFEFDELSNNFHMDIANKEVSPDGQIQLSINGRPGSYVALAAYDKRLHQYGSSHDLSWHDVEQLYAQFHDVEPNEFDVFQGVGIFVRGSDDLGLTTGINKAGRRGSSDVSTKRIPDRTHFAESFLWKHVTLQSSGRLNLTECAPHTITQWYINGFSMDPVFGLGIIKKPIVLTTMKSFYIVDHLPYSIKRGEVVEMIFTLFNNGSESILANVTMYNVKNEIEFVEQPSGEMNYTKPFTVHAHERIPVSFLVKAKKLGEIHVRVLASNAYESDAIEKVIRVLPESFVEMKMESRSFYHDSLSNTSFFFQLDVDKKADPGSQKINFIINPNLHTTKVQDLGDLLTVSTGTDDQSRVRFVPTVIVLEYLHSTDSKDTKLMEKATNLLKQAYHNQMRYRQTDGSFGERQNGERSVFLTAFVVKSMQTAAKYIAEVDNTIVERAFEWLASKQHSSGRFDEVDQTLHTDMQGDLRNGTALTAFVLIAFMENQQAKVTHASVVAKGIEFVANHLPDEADLYVLSIATYALMLNNHSQMGNYFKTLMDRSTSIQHGTMRYWASEPHEIETTAYALLAMVQARKFFEVVPVMRWLANQRFVAESLTRTRDTFVGLKALSRLAEQISPSKNNYIIQLKYQRHVETFKVTSQDIDPKEFNDIPGDVRKMEVNVAGIGFGWLDVKYEYSLNLRNFPNRFDLKLEKLNTNSNDTLQLKICTSFITKSESIRSNMALIEVNFPSGYVVDNNPISKATTVNPIMNVEIRFGATSVLVYYDSMGNENNCFHITAYRRLNVALKRPVYVLVHDYYDPKLNAIQGYDVDEQHVCYTCD